MKRHRIICNVFLSVVLTLLVVPRAQAASLQKVEQNTWGVSGLPSYVNMYIYVPEKLAPKPPLLVASHHCGGSANSTFNETKSTFVALADKNGFVIIFPEATGHNCWDVGSAKSLQHDGGGDTHAIAQMVRYTLSKYDGDASRVYAFGTSSGAMMTEALLGVYADMFMAGVSVAGVPCGCWAEQYSGDSGANPQWSGPCAGGNVSKTAQAWGDLVRSMDPGYSGHRPRVQLWHGTADTTISFKNFGESIKEWTNILQLPDMPSASDSAKSGYTHQTWKNACGYVALEAWAQQGAGHDVSWDAASAESFLGLDRVGGEDPEAQACASSSGAAGMMSAAGSGGAAAHNDAAGRGATPNGSVAGAAGIASAPGAAAGGAGGNVAAISGASGMRAAAGRAGEHASSSQPSTAAGTNASGAGMPATSGAGIPAEERARPSSSAGCSCVIGTRAALPTTRLSLFLLAALAWLRRAASKRRQSFAGTPDVSPTLNK